MFLLWAHFHSDVFCTWGDTKGQLKEQHFLWKLVRIIDYHHTEQIFKQWYNHARTLHMHKIMESLRMEKTWKIKLRGEDWDLNSATKHLLTNNTKEWLPSSPMGLDTIRLPSDPLLCSNACLWLPVHTNATPCRTMAKEWPHGRCGCGRQGATHPLGWKQKAFNSFQETGGNQQNWALYLFRFVSVVGCFQGWRHRWIKKTTMVLHDPLSAYTTFSFSAFC